MWSPIISSKSDFVNKVGIDCTYREPLPVVMNSCNARSGPDDRLSCSVRTKGLDNARGLRCGRCAGNTDDSPGSEAIDVTIASRGGDPSVDSDEGSSISRTNCSTSAGS